LAIKRYILIGHSAAGPSLCGNVVYGLLYVVHLLPRVMPFRELRSCTQGCLGAFSTHVSIHNITRTCNKTLYASLREKEKHDSDTTLFMRHCANSRIASDKLIPLVTRLAPPSLSLTVSAVLMKCCFVASVRDRPQDMSLHWQPAELVRLIFTHRFRFRYALDPVPLLLFTNDTNLYVYHHCFHSCG